MEEVKGPTPEEIEHDALVTKAIATAEQMHMEGQFNKSHWGDYWADDGLGFDVVDSAGQHMFIRVGMVFTDGANKPDRTPGVWITYQEHYMHSPAECLLLSPETFEAIVRHYKRRQWHSSKLYHAYWRVKCVWWDLRYWLTGK